MAVPLDLMASDYRCPDTVYRGLSQVFLSPLYHCTIVDIQGNPELKESGQ